VSGGTKTAVNKSMFNLREMIIWKLTRGVFQVYVVSGRSIQYNEDADAIITAEDETFKTGDLGCMNRILDIEFVMMR
jgi:hypothetical protein